MGERGAYLSAENEHLPMWKLRPTRVSTVQTQLLFVVRSLEAEGGGTFSIGRVCRQRTDPATDAAFFAVAVGGDGGLCVGHARPRLAYSRHLTMQLGWHGTWTFLPTLLKFGVTGVQPSSACLEPYLGLQEA